MNKLVLYSFDEFEIDPTRRQICRSGVPVPVPQKAFQLLLFLIENPGRVLAKAEIMKAVWPQARVEESNLTQSIFLLRKALGEQPGRARYIVTVAGEGYQFAVHPQVVHSQVVEKTQQPEPLPATDRHQDEPQEIKSPEIPSQASAVQTAISPAVSPVRTRAVRFTWKAAGLAIAGVVLLASTLLGIRKLTRKPQLAGNGNVVLSDFSNSTGDPAFNAALRQGLASQLEQSPFLGLVSESRIAQTLKMMEQPKGAVLTPDLARQVCERTGSAAFIDGSISSLGRQFVLGLKALNCKSGETLAEDQETADSKEQVLTALGIAAGKLRRKLGESLPSLEKYDAPPADVTTASLEALEAYGLGIKAQSTGDCPTAIAFYKQAVSLDPGFAMAFSHLGVCDPSEEGANATRKAYSLRDKVSQREKFYLDSHYEQYATGNLAAARNILETWSATYPHDSDIAANLLKLYLTTGDYEEALPLVRTFVQNSPGTAGPSASRLASTLIYLNRFDEAKAVLLDTEAHHNDGPVHHYFMYELDFLQNDSAAMAKEASYLHTQKGWLGNSLELESVSAAYFGKFALSRSLSEQATQDALREQDAEGAAGTLAEAALQEALAGNVAVATKKCKASLALSKTASVEILAAMAASIAGDEADATRLIDDLNHRFPTDTIAQAAVATARATLLLGNGKSQDAKSRDPAKRALEAIAPASPYGMSATLYMVPVYIRGQAHLAAAQSSNAAADFQNILDHSGVTRNFITGPLARLGLAKAQEQAGETAKARANYAEFLRLWRDADPGIPQLKTATDLVNRLSP